MCTRTFDWHVSNGPTGREKEKTTEWVNTVWEMLAGSGGLMYAIALNTMPKPLMLVVLKSQTRCSSTGTSRNLEFVCI